VPLNEAKKPRSGVGLNDLLGRTEGTARTRQGEQGRQSAHAAEVKPVGAQQSEAGTSATVCRQPRLPGSERDERRPAESERDADHDKRRANRPKNTREGAHPLAGLLNLLALMRPNA
jgi:hypothetical protein